ncbi:hypothetical protein DYB32_002156 [Aphanomyces invadans]|uniref:Phospholipid/glycerol acyltransferase domain-containing protein n=1 Tax=Aphanomyces invadans TaxID=157072 RepID=A0A418B491_9STRA|nr:hypothetical protein DYB32_002156 [Aphanomyces invadans]
MEKYSRWSDLTTGINPFVPPPHQLPKNVVLRWTQLFLGGILSLCRWIVLVPLLMLLVVVTSIHAVLDYVPILGRIFHRWTDSIVLGLILIVTTVFIKDEAANAKRLGLLYVTGSFHAFLMILCSAPGTKPPTLSGIQAGDVIVTNHTSVFDVLYLGFRYSPTFVFPCASDASKVLVHAWLIKRLPLLWRQYEYKAIAPTHTCGSAVWHLCRLFSHVYHTIKVTTLPSELVAKDSTPQQLQALLASMLRTKGVELSCDDFISFNAYWAHVNRGGRQPASDFTSRKAPHEHAQWTRSDK